MISEKTLDARIDREYAAVVAASTKPGNFEAAKELIEGFCKAENLEHSGKWHFARGMRDVREIDPDNTRRAIWLQYYIRILARARCVKDVDEIWQEGDVELIDKYSPLSGCEIFTMSNGDFIYLDNPVKHEVVEGTDGSMRLHCEDGPAIEFADGSKLYAIDDINVPEWVVMTPADEMDVKEVLGIEDVDARMIALRKVGLDRCLDGARRVANGGEYVLYDLAHLFDGQKALYLDMVNPSSGEHHLEGVDNDCETVADAIRFRAGRDWNPCEIDGVKREGGDAGQYQQGDVLIARVEEIPSDLPILEGRGLLSSDNQRRHVAKGISRLSGSDEKQYVVADEGWEIVHPEHGTQKIPAGKWEVWGVVEVDHITGILRTVVD